MNDKLLWLKWTVLVWANAVVDLMLSSKLFHWYTNPNYTIGIILGICTFIPIYVCIDNYAIKRNNKRLQKSLLISVSLRAIIQFLVVIDLYAILIATKITDRLSKIIPIMDNGFLEGFFLTVLMGGILSLVVAVIFIFILFLTYLE